jgi:membrane protease YdiL (CAAX protease family)
MRKLEHFTIEHPIAFGFLLILAFPLLSTLTWPITQIYPFPEGHELGNAIAKLIITACFILLLWRFGWLKSAGFISVGAKSIWALAIVLMIYNAILGIFAYTGRFWIGLPPIGLALAIIIYSFATSLVEETMYRGLLLTAMVKAWGGSHNGLFAAAFLSGLFWASLHFFNLLIRPFPIVALNVLGMIFVGILYAGIVLAGRSIWPAIIFHWVINASINLQLSQIMDFEVTVTSNILFFLVVLPLTVVGGYLLRKKSLERDLRQEQTHYGQPLEKNQAKVGHSLG